MDAIQEATSPLSPPNGLATIDAPELTKSETGLQLERKSIRNVQHAANCCRGLEWDNRQRNLRAGDIQQLMDGCPPKSAGANREAGKSWQANASTLWLAGIVGRVAQRFVNAIISQIYVTSSSLPESYPDAKTKTDLLRAKFTSLIRGWNGNTGLINAISTETALQGYSYCAFLDPYTFLPEFFKQDELYVPDKSGQHAREIQFFCARRDFRLDKFLELFMDESAARDNGYDLDNCFEAASKASMQNPRDDAVTMIFRKFADMIDEGTIGLGMSGSGQRIVKTWLLFNREYDGQVSFWLIERETGKLLRFSFKLFKKMEDVLTIFSFEAGNGCIHSSKGLGRKLASLAILKETFRCGIIDNARVGSLMVIRMDAAGKTKFSPVIAAPFVIIDKSVDINPLQFEFNAEAYKVVDLLIDSWAEQAVGAYLAAQINDKGKTERTATEASIDARRESEAADIMIRRCLDQDATRIQMQQLRVCSKDNIKEARRIYAKITADPMLDKEELYGGDVDDANLMRFLVEAMTAGITDDELKVWSRSPASAFAHVTEAAIQQGVTAAKQLFTNNTNIDQGALDYATLEGLVGANMAKLLFIPKANETTATEAARKQQIESFVMAGSGMPLAVSVRDNHLIEAAAVQEILTKAIAPVLSKADAPDNIMTAARLNLDHLGAHLQAAEQQGLNKLPAFVELEKFYQGFKQQLGQVVAIKAEAQVAQQLVAQHVRQGGVTMTGDGTPSAPAGPAPAASGNVISPGPGAFTAPPPAQIPAMGSMMANGVPPVKRFG